MVKVKITINCSVGRWPDQNSVLFITTIDSTVDMGEAIKIATKRALQVSCVRDFQVFRLVSIEELE